MYSVCLNPDFLDAKVEINPLWGSRFKNNRLLIRKNILEVLKSSKVPFDQNNILNLSKRPMLANISISISHANTVGGFLIAPESGYGFDIETKNVSKKVLKRIDVLGDSEFFIKNQIENLYWSSKEASLKAISNYKTLKPSIFDIHILPMVLDKCKNSLTYKFYYLTNTKISGVGVSTKMPNYTCSMAKVPKPASE